MVVVSREVYKWFEDAVTRGVCFDLKGHLLIVGKPGDETIDAEDDRFIKAHRYEIAELLRPHEPEPVERVN